MSHLALSVLSFPEWSPALIVIDLSFLGLPSFPVRWYSLAYIAALLLGWYYALALSRRPALWGGTQPPIREAIDDLLFYATLGVILGGRLGYIIFYQLPFQWQRTLEDPWSLLRIWEGGMSFHGGLLGVCMLLYLLARRHSLKLLTIGDIVAVVTPMGICFGRLANFINAELYGRPTTSSWGMIFPEGYAGGGTPSAYDWATQTWLYTGLEQPRYPSQLYEAVLEGLIPALVLAVLVWRSKALSRPGLCAGLFLLLYGFGRSLAEYYREPDSFVSSLPLHLTMGQLLSAPMWIGGAFLLWRALNPKLHTA